MISEKEIWDDFRKGESYALSHIYNKYIQLLFEYGKKFTYDNDLIKDSIQDLFFELIRTRKNLGDTDNIKFYFMYSYLKLKVTYIRLQQNFKSNTLTKT